MPFVILPTNSISGGYDITNSLRAEGASSDSLNINFSTSGNRKTFTLSFWFKKVKNATSQSLFRGDTTQTSNYNHDSIYIDSSDKINFGGYNSNFIVTTAVFRDLSAWYHIVLSVDTTQATTSNRIKLYVNSIEQARTEQGGYPAQNTDLAFTKSGNHAWFGSDPFSGLGYGYLAEAYLIDGQALTPSSFGETDFDTGIWKPKAFSGSFGTNGFYLQFKNSASLGTDSSGNGNTFTVNNLTSIDQTTDTPTNNFSTFNALLPPPVTLSNGNLTATTSGTANMSGGTIGVSQGKWYAEFKIGNTPISIGIAPVGFRAELGSSSDSYSYKNSANKYTNGVDTAYGVSYTNGDIISVALDMDNGTLIFYKNGSSQGTAFTSISGTFTFGFGRYTGTEVSCDANFGNPPYSANSYTDGAGFGNFSYSVPSGYYSLNTRNLANFG